MESKLIFLTIGYIEWRKGQDLLIDAIEQIPANDLANCEFVFVGQDGSVMANDLKNRTRQNINISFVGTVKREEIHNLLDNANVLLCPSREDPMPTVCAEAMMHSVPCVVSDATGVSEYLIDGYNGLVFHSEDVDALKYKVLWCINHKDELVKIGKNARKVFEKVFSIDVFEKNIISYVDEMLLSN